jgi:peptide/nickel transport system substrate-binding protein
MFKSVSFGSCLAAAALLAATPSFAQKSKDTLRIAANDQYSVLSPHDLPLDEAAPFYNQIYSPLMVVDEANGKFVPELAKSWKHINPTTIEFELRDDIVLHSGKKFNADDIIAMINYVIDPKTKIRSKNRYTWVKSTEKLGPYKFRAHLAEPYALDLFAFTYRFVAEDSDILNKLENKADYGRVSAASAGPYKLTGYDRNQGFTLERFKDLKIAHRRAPIGHVQIIPVTDDQTQIAQLLTGGIDVLRNVSEDNARELAKKPGIEVTPTRSSQYAYFMMDAIARSGRKEFTDLRVRKAFTMAVDREEIAKKIIPGGDKVGEVMDALCYPFTSGCSVTKKPYPYNVAEAKKLMAEAGYANGFEVNIPVHAPYKDVAEAIAGYLRAINVRATVQPMTISQYVKAREDGQLTMFVGARPTANFPETIEVMEGFHQGSRDYWKDDIILKALDDAKKIADVAQRTKVLQPAIDRNNEQAYVIPIATLPWVFAHSKDVRIGESQFKPRTVDVSDIFWK